MKVKTKAMIRSLLFYFQEDETILRFLSKDEEEEIRRLNPPAHPNFPAALSPMKAIEKIHYSWFTPYLSTLPQKTQQLFMPLFSPSQRLGLEKMLKVEAEPTKLPLLTKLYLVDLLIKNLQIEEVIPLALLPKGPLNSLIKIKWSHLMEVIDILALYDLACDFRQIVDQGLIKRIYKMLPDQHVAFLHFASKQPIRWVSPKLNLEHWDGDEQKLLTLLHKRGLMRLTKGVLEEHPSFRWHLIHRLDRGRAEVMMEALTEPVDGQLIPYFKQQLLQIASKVVQ